MQVDLYATSNRPPRPEMDGFRHIVIIGGGASGTLMAAHLLRDPDTALRVTIIEGRHMLGCGVAYSTLDPNHLLNTRVQSMSAFADDPDHFRRWLSAQGDPAAADGFVGRATYGSYMTDLLAPLSGAADGRLRCLRASCLRLSDSPAGLQAHLDDDRTVDADAVVLATGHALPERNTEGLIHGAWEAAPPIPNDGRVVIVGSGLSMIDQALTLLSQGHKGEIVVMSRRSQMPRIHSQSRALPIAAADLPLGAPVSVLMAWLRNLVTQANAQGGTWRDAVDGLRPHLRAIWRALPNAERARFLRHAAPWWEVHRHRLPTESAAPINRALRTGRLRLVAGAFLGADHDAQGRLVARYRPRGESQARELTAARITDCRGIRRDPETNATPLIADLLTHGWARIDPLRLGLDVAPDCAIIAADGTPEPRIRAIGPVSRAAFWEITAIPDIREQTAALAADLLRQLQPA